MSHETVFHSRRSGGFRAHDRRGGVSQLTLDSSDVRLSVPARPENVAVIRHVLGAFAEAFHLPADRIEDMRLAVTEACSNVIRHAYPENESGAIDVTIRPGGGRIEFVVADRGRGIGPSADVAGPGLGLPLIAALADSLEITHHRGRGSRISMSFKLEA
jgi:serine/threonine-protein kinase RsbW